MKDYSPIEAIVPKPWGMIGRVCNILVSLMIVGYIWLLFISPEPPDEELIGVGYFSFFFAPFWFLLIMPLYLNRYPSWVVRLVGRKYLIRIIEDCKRYSGQNQDNNPQLSGPKKWFENKRFFWLFVTGCGALGVLKGAGLL